MLNNKELLEEFLSLLNKASGTIRNYHYICNWFLSWNEEHNNDKYLLNTEKIDLKQYNKYLNEDHSLTLKTKQLRYNLVRVFIKETLTNHTPDLKALGRDPFDLLQLLGFLDKTSEFSTKQDNHNYAREKVFITEEELRYLFNYIKHQNYMKYLMFRVLLETGCRKLGLRKLQLDVKINSHVEPIETYIKKREIIITKSKTLNVDRPYFIYHFSEDLRDKLLDYIKNTRRQMDLSYPNYLFLSSYKKGFSPSSLNYYLKSVIEKINNLNGKEVIRPTISIHSFRRTLNNLRVVKKECSDIPCSILLNQKVDSINFNSYVDQNKSMLELYDKYTDFFPSLSIF